MPTAASLHRISERVRCGSACAFAIAGLLVVLAMFVNTSEIELTLPAAKFEANWEGFSLSLGGVTQATGSWSDVRSSAQLYDTLRSFFSARFGGLALAKAAEIEDQAEKFMRSLIFSACFAYWSASTLVKTNKILNDSGVRKPVRPSELYTVATFSALAGFTIIAVITAFVVWGAADSCKTLTNTFPTTGTANVKVSTPATTVLGFAEFFAICAAIAAGVSTIPECIAQLPGIRTAVESHASAPQEGSVQDGAGTGQYQMAGLPPAPIHQTQGLAPMTGPIGPTHGSSLAGPTVASAGRVWAYYPNVQHGHPPAFHPGYQLGGYPAPGYAPGPQQQFMQHPPCPPPFGVTPYPQPPHHAGSPQHHGQA